MVESGDCFVWAKVVLKGEKMKKYITFFLSCMLLVFQCSFVFAEEPEQYEMVEMENDDIFGLNSRSEVSPALLYIANVYTSIVAISSNQVGNCM